MNKNSKAKQFLRTALDYAKKFLVVFFLIFSILRIICYFEIITEKEWFLLSLCGSVISTVVFIVNNTNKRVTKFDVWVNANRTKLFLAYAFSLFFFTSIRFDEILTIERMKELLSVEWVIFGLSIAMFAIWEITIPDYLSRRIPPKQINNSLMGTAIHIWKKQSFASQINNATTSAVLLFSNLILLLFETGLVYGVFFSAPLTNAVMGFVLNTSLFFVFYLCSNTIMCIFYDILKPLIAKKKELMKGNSITQEDADTINDINNKIDAYMLIRETINNSQRITDEQKDEMLRELLFAITGEEGLLETKKHDDSSLQSKNT